MMRSRGDTTVSPLLFAVIKKILICIFVLLFFGMVHAEDKKTEIPLGNSPSMGPVDAPITIIEFIDFQ